MDADRPQLITFGISHYCEKARWALDYCNIDYRIELLAPGPHIKFCRSLGLGDTTLPVLVAGGSAIQGSSQIIDWAEASRPDAGASGSVTSQTFREWELIAVNDGSTDGTMEILEAAGKRDRRIRLLRVGQRSRLPPRGQRRCRRSAR